MLGLESTVVLAARVNHRLKETLTMKSHHSQALTGDAHKWMSGGAKNRFVAINSKRT